MEEVKHALHKELLVVPKVVTSGVGDFCDQVILLLNFITNKLCVWNVVHNVVFCTSMVGMPYYCSAV